MYLDKLKFNYLCLSKYINVEEIMNRTGQNAWNNAIYLLILHM